MIGEKCGCGNDVCGRFIDNSKTYLKKLVDEGAFMDISIIADIIAMFLRCGEIDIPTDTNLSAQRNSELSFLFDNSKDVKKMYGRYHAEIIYDKKCKIF